MERQLTFGRMTVLVRTEPPKTRQSFWTSPVMKKFIQIYSATWEAKSAGKIPLHKQKEFESES